MKEKLNLTNLTKMTKKDLQATKGGDPQPRCYNCVCFVYPEVIEIDAGRLSVKYGI
ncbi:MAG: hypothetical protein NT166_13275 [Candidatus Aminicenantes bacterium]|nr:hypothetical protein [Candidatus Aminicenantes bacterium]